MSALKNNFNKERVTFLSSEIKKVYPDFNSKKFQKDIFKTLLDLELKDRVKLISNVLKLNLPENYEKSIGILLKTLCHEKEYEKFKWQGKEIKGVHGFLVWPYTQFVQDFGLEDFEVSMMAIYEMTKRFTGEFAIRDFIQKYDKDVFKLLNTWSKDPSYHVRRLVSEGTRPSLPWATKVDVINKNLNRNIQLLEKLKNDSDEYVRKSLANHLNDISKIDEDLMLRTCERWSKPNDLNMQKLIRHACRTLLKKANLRALKLNEFTLNPKVKKSKVSVCSKKIRKGDSLQLQLEITSSVNYEQNLLIDYHVQYPSTGDKVKLKQFRYKQINLLPYENLKLSKKITFKDLSIRTLILGNYQISIKIGDLDLGQCTFQIN